MNRSILVRTFDAIDERGNRYQVGEYQEMMQLQRSLSDESRPALPGLLHYKVMGSGERVSIDGKGNIEAIGIGKLTQL